MSRKLMCLLMSYLVLLIGLTPLTALATIEWTFSPSCSAPPCATDTGGFKTFLGADASGSGAGPSVVASGWGSTAASAGSASVTNAYVPLNPALNVSAPPAPTVGVPPPAPNVGANPAPNVGANPIAYVPRNPALNVSAPPAPTVGAPPAPTVGAPPDPNVSAPPIAYVPRNPVLNAGGSGPGGGPAIANAPPDLILFPTPTPSGATCVPVYIPLSQASSWQTGYGTSGAANTGVCAPDLTGGNSTATTANLTTTGWGLIGSNTVGSDPQPVNSGGGASSNWIVSPYSPALCNNGNCVPDSLNSPQDTGLNGNVVATNLAAAAIPVPGTLLLLAGGLPLIRRMRS